MRRSLHIGVAQHLRHSIERRMLHEFPERWIVSITANAGRRNDEFSHRPWMSDRDLQCDVPAVAEAEEVGFFNLEMLEQSGCVVRGLFEGEWSVGDIGGSAVTLLLEGNDLSRLC